MHAASRLIVSSVVLALSLTVDVGTSPNPAFPQGVASGEVTPTSAVLWTRVDSLTSVKVEVSTKQNLVHPGSQWVTGVIDGIAG